MISISLDLKDVSTIIAILGGIFGFMPFFDAYILKFNPSIKLSNTLYLTYTNMQHGSALTSLICKLDIFNRRNKIGRIDDFCIKIYNSDEMKPSIHNLYSTFELDKFPSDPTIKISKSPFSPKSILNKSNQSVTLEFSDIDNGKAYIPPRNLHFDLYYKLHTEKWIKLGTFSLNTINDPVQLGDQQIYISSTWELAEARRKFSERSIKTQLSIYTGVFEYHLSPWLRQPMDMIRHKTKRCLTAIWLLKDYCASLYEYLVTELLIYPALKVKNKILRPSFTHGNKEHSDISNKTMNKIYDTLNAKINDINEKSDEAARITLKRTSNEITLNRNNNDIKIYRAGDGFIGVQTRNTHSIFWIRLTDYVWGIRLWRMNNRAMSIKSICTTILNYFMYHSNYR